MSNLENLDATDDVASGDTSDPLSPDEYGELKQRMLKWRFRALKLIMQHRKKSQVFFIV